MATPVLANSTGLSALYHLIRSKRDKSFKSSKDSSARSEKERGEKEQNASTSSLWSRANSLRQSLRHRSHKHAQSTSISVLIDDLPKGRKGIADDYLRREWGSHRDLSRSRKAQSSAFLSASDASRQVVRRHSSKSRPGDHALSAADPVFNKPPPIAVQEETRMILAIDKLSQDFEFGLECRDNSSGGSDALGKQRILQLSTHDLEDGRDRSGGSVKSPFRKSQPNPQRKLTKDSGYEASLCSEPDYVNALFLCGSATGSMLRRSQPSWDSPMAVSEPLSLPSGSYAGGLSCAGFGNVLQTSPVSAACSKGVGEHENAHRRFSPASVTYDTLATSRSKESLKHLAVKTSSSNLLKQNEALSSDRKTVASWLSRQQKQKPHVDRTSPSKSYEDIYEKVGDSDVQQERHLRSASDPLANQDEKSGWPPRAGATDRVAGDNSDSSTYIDSVGSEMKWGDSYSDLSAFSVRSSNQSSGFESGQSTAADNGRISPQSSLDGSAMMGGYGERIISRCPLPAKEGVAHSAKIPSVERHCSESVLYFENQMKNSKGMTMSSCSVNSQLSVEKHEEDVLKSSLLHEAESTEDIGRPLDPLRRTKLPEHDIKLIQKQAVLSYLRQRQEASVGAKPAQFRNEPPETAEKPTPIKPMTAVKLLEDSSVPPELPPKLFKSSELLHGVVRRPKELRSHNESSLPITEKKKPPLPPPKTFKLNSQLKQAFYPSPPPIKEKPEKLRQRRGNDSSLVMAKMVYIPLASPTEDLEQSSREASADRRKWTTGSVENASLRYLPTEKAKPFQPPLCSNTDSQTRPTRRDNETAVVRKSFDDEYGTCLDDDDDVPATESDDALEKKLTPMLQPQQQQQQQQQLPPPPPPLQQPQQPKGGELDPVAAKAASSRNKQSAAEAHVLEEIRVNNLFEAELRAKLQELRKTNELRKFSNYVSEVDDIAALVVKLSLRIGRTTAILNKSAEGAASHKAQLVQKLEKMEQELDEARRLEANCEKRWSSFGAHLSTFLGSGQLIERYLHFMKDRGDLLVKQRIIVDRQHSVNRKV